MKPVILTFLIITCSFTALEVMAQEGDEAPAGRLTEHLGHADRAAEPFVVLFRAGERALESLEHHHRDARHDREHLHREVPGLLPAPDDRRAESDRRGLHERADVEVAERLQIDCSSPSICASMVRGVTISSKVCPSRV